MNAIEQNTRDAVHEVALKLHLKKGARLALADADDTQWEPDCLDYIVKKFALRPHLWDQAFIEYKKGIITVSDVYQRGLDLCYENPSFSFADAITELKKVHTLIEGMKELQQTFAKVGIHTITITNTVIEIYQPMLEYHGLTHIPVIGNKLAYQSGRPIYVPMHGDCGLNKLLVAQEFVRQGYIPIVGLGDARSDIGLIKVAIENGGFGLARRGCSLSKWCSDNAAVGSWISYEAFTPFILKWLEKKLHDIKGEMAA